MRPALVTFPADNGTTVEVESKIISTLKDLEQYAEEFTFNYVMLKDVFKEMIKDGVKIIVNRRGGWCTECDTIKIVKYLDHKPSNTKVIWPPIVK